MRGGRAAALLAALLTTATADLAVHVKTYSDAACSTAVADYQVPWKYGAASSGHTCVAIPAALTITSWGRYQPRHLVTLAT